MSVLSATELSFSYGRRRVLNNVSLEFSNGITGLLGANGTGKTTLLRLLALQGKPDAGSVAVGGTLVDSTSTARKAQANIGYLPQRFDVMPFKTVRANVEFSAWAHGLNGKSICESASFAIHQVGLSDRQEERAFRLSGGMHQRLGLACAIVHKPQVLILDEPTVGIDPIHRAQTRRLLKEMSNNAAIILSSHMIEDIVQTCDRALIMGEQRIIFDGTVEELKRVGRSYREDSDTESDAEVAYLKLVGDL